MRPVVISAIAITVIAGAPESARAKTYKLQQYPEGLASVPCNAFKRGPNGSWKEAAVFVYNGQRFSGNTYQPGSREAGIIEQHCK